MVENINVALIGCGMIADAHAKLISNIPNARVIAVCDSEPLMAAQLADRYNIPNHFPNFKKLHQTCRPDVVHILTPPSTHFPLGMEALEAGCHVLLEKPFTVNAVEAKTLLDTAAILGKKIIVNHFHNFSPPSLRLRKMIKQGRIGTVLHMDGYYGYSVKSPVAKALFEDKHSWIHRLPGTVLQNNIDHLIGKFTEYIPDPEPTVWVHAKKLSREVKRIAHSEIYDELRVMLAGRTVTAYATFSSNIQPFQHYMIVFGTKGSVIVDYESRSIVTVPVSGLPGPFGKLAAPFITGRKYISEGVKNVIAFAKSDFHFYAGASRLFQDFYRCVRDNAPPPLDYDYMMKTVTTLDNIFARISENPDVTPGPPKPILEEEVAMQS